MAYEGPHPFPVPSGGTGATTLTAHAVLVGEGTSSIVAVGPSATAGQLLIGAGVSADPSFVTPTVGTGLSLTTNASTLSYAISAPVSIANGGTDATSFSTSNGIVKYDGTRLVSSSTFTLNSSNYANNSSQPLVSAYVNTSVNNVTGDGTNYTVLFNTVLVNNSSSYVSGSGVFTAPVAGNYLVTGSIGLTGLGAADTAGIILVGFTARTYQMTAMNYGAIRDVNNNLVVPFSVISPMAISDQVLIGVQVSNGTKNIGVLGSANPLTFLGIYLLS